MKAIIIAGLLAFAAAGVGYAADDSLEKSAKKTADGFGELLKGMGQEIKKSGIVGDPKKDEKKDAKTPGAKDKEEPK